MAKKTPSNWSVRDGACGIHGFFAKHSAATDYIKSASFVDSRASFLEIWHLEDDGRHHPYHPEDYYRNETPPHITEANTKKGKAHAHHTAGVSLNGYC